MKTILTVWAAASAAIAIVLPGWWKLLALTPWAVLALAGVIGRLLAYQPQHAATAAGWAVSAEPGYPGYGSMILAEETGWRGYPQTAESGVTTTPKTELINGHTLGCLCPEGDHHWTACPEEDDWPDEDETPGPLPDMFPARPPALVDAALAFAADDAADAGWTDQLLADLRDTPTVLDEPPAFVIHEFQSQLADAGDIELISQRADYAAELRAQDADTREWLSRFASGLAEFRLHGLS